MKQHIQRKFQTGQQGFALIATISVMVLLVMIALAMLSLSTIELRQSGNAKHQQEARANARMALMIAMGELQKYAGPDQRVTATAGIHSDASDEKKNLTGVWSTENWDPQNPDTKELLTWLATVPVNNPGAPELLDVESPVTAYNVAGSEVITVVGDGSTVGDHVSIATVPVVNGSGTLTGSYGYWVSDEASKASYAVPIDETPEPWEEASKMGVAAHTAVEVLDSSVFSSYVDQMKTGQAAQNAATYQTLDVMFPTASKVAKQYFYDLTTKTTSLLTNTRHGGLKSDLSTAFELDLAEFNAVDEFHNSTETNNTSAYTPYNAAVYNQPEFYPQSHQLGYLFEVPDHQRTDYVVRGPTWDLLRNHYRLYKNEWDQFHWPRKFDVSSKETFSARGGLPLSYSKGDGSAFYGGHDNVGSTCSCYTNQACRNVSSPVGSGQISRSTAAKIEPLVTRITMVLGLRKVSTGTDPSDWRLAFSMDPYITIVNPYNRAIEFESLGIYAYKYNPLRFTLSWTDQSGNAQTRSGLQFGNTYYTEGSLAYRILPLPTTHRLNPGEVRVLSPLPKGGVEQKFAYRSKNFVEATFSYGEDSGLYVFPEKNHQWYGGPRAIQPKAGTAITVEMTGRGQNENALDCFHVSQFLHKDHQGVERDISTHLPGKIGVGRDVFDDPLITSIHFDTRLKMDKASDAQHEMYVKRTVNASDIPSLGESGQYIGAFDIRMKHGGEDAPIFHQFDPRAEIFNMKNYDGSARTGVAWSVEMTAITDVSDLQLVGNAQAQGFWGGGNDAANGSSKVVLFDLPRSPLTSLGSLSQADIAVLPAGGASLIGNSFAHPGLPDVELIAGRRPVTGIFSRQPGTQELVDSSWAANDALWDQYFFSSINWGDTTLAFDGAQQEYANQDDAVSALKAHANSSTITSPLLNPRIKYSPSHGTGDIDDELKDYKKISKHLAVQGGFNVNSTSVNAWRAVLSALKNHEVNYLNNASSGTAGDKNADVSFSRFQLPAGKHDENWSGFRSLNDTEISKLAEAVVEQVKSRGPFMGLSDFVNRRLSDSVIEGSEVGKLGALQMAIEGAGINDSLHHDVGITNMENKEIGLGGGKTMTVSALTGIPGYLMQADILTSVGSILRTRSDTFVIRTYGDSKDKNGKVLARAWCEATVQRVPEWIAQTDIPYKTQDPNYPDLTTKPIIKKWTDNSSFPEVNRKFGRKMEVISFRWMSENEV